MSGRFAITSPPEAVRAAFGYEDQPVFPPRYNVAPTQPIGVVFETRIRDRRVRRFSLMRWGFIPSFVKDVKAFPLLVNARAESAPERASFRAAFRRRRALVPADAFYEWRPGENGGPKQAYLVRRIDRAILGLAALYETYLDPSGGEIDTVCILTIEAKDFLRKLQARMPAILPSEMFARWLDCDGVSPDEAETLLDMTPADELELQPIGPEVGKVGNDSDAIQTPTAPPIRA